MQLSLEKRWPVYTHHNVVYHVYDPIQSATIYTIFWKCYKKQGRKITKWTVRIKPTAAAARHAHLRHLSHHKALRIYRTSSSSELSSRSQLPAEQQFHPERLSQWCMLLSTCFQGLRSAGLWTHWLCPVWLRCIPQRGGRRSSISGTCDPCSVWETRRRSAIIDVNPLGRSNYHVCSLSIVRIFTKLNAKICNIRIYHVCHNTCNMETNSMLASMYFRQDPVILLVTCRGWKEWCQWFCE